MTGKPDSTSVTFKGQSMRTKLLPPLSLGRAKVSGVGEVVKLNAIRSSAFQNAFYGVGGNVFVFLLWCFFWSPQRGKENHIIHGPMGFVAQTSTVCWIFLGGNHSKIDIKMKFPSLTNRKLIQPGLDNYHRWDHHWSQFMNCILKLSFGFSV